MHSLESASLKQQNQIATEFARNSVEMAHVFFLPLHDEMIPVCSVSQIKWLATGVKYSSVANSSLNGREHWCWSFIQPRVQQGGSYHILEIASVATWGAELPSGWGFEGDYSCCHCQGSAGLWCPAAQLRSASLWTFGNYSVLSESWLEIFEMAWEDFHVVWGIVPLSWGCTAGEWFCSSASSWVAKKLKPMKYKALV